MSSNSRERDTVFRAARAIAGDKRLVDVFDDSCAGEMRRAKVRRLVRSALGCSLEQADLFVQEYLL